MGSSFRNPDSHTSTRNHRGESRSVAELPLKQPLCSGDSLCLGRLKNHPGEQGIDAMLAPPLFLSSPSHHTIHLPLFHSSPTSSTSIGRPMHCTAGLLSTALCACIIKLILWLPRSSPPPLPFPFFPPQRKRRERRSGRMVRREKMGVAGSTGKQTRCCHAHGSDLCNPCVSMVAF